MLRSDPLGRFKMEQSLSEPVLDWLAIYYLDIYQEHGSWYIVYYHNAELDVATCECDHKLSGSARAVRSWRMLHRQHVAEILAARLMDERDRQVQIDQAIMDLLVRKQVSLKHMAERWLA